jgi:transcriptional regulator with XRE-family HTH domain
MTTRWDQAIREVLEQARAHLGGNAALARALREAGVGPDSGTYSESAVSNWVKGRTMPPSDVILAVAMIAGQSLDKYLGVQPYLPAPISLQPVAEERLATIEASIRDLYQRIGQGFVGAAPSGTPTRSDYLDLAAIYSTRMDYIAQLSAQEQLRAARTIDCAGLSLNVIAQQLGDLAIRELVENRTVLRFLFLNPHGSAIEARNREEGLAEGSLKSLTQLNISAMLKVQESLSSEAQSRLQLRVYDATPRFNILIVDQAEAIVQPYLPSARGLESPTFVLRYAEAEPHGLFHTFAEVFNEIWSGAHEIIQQGL